MLLGSPAVGPIRVSPSVGRVLRLPPGSVHCIVLKNGRNHECFIGHPRNSLLLLSAHPGAYTVTPDDSRRRLLPFTTNMVSATAEFFRSVQSRCPCSTTGTVVRVLLNKGTAGCQCRKRKGTSANQTAPRENNGSARSTKIVRRTGNSCSIRSATSANRIDDAECAAHYKKRGSSVQLDSIKNLLRPMDIT